MRAHTIFLAAAFLAGANSVSAADDELTIAKFVDLAQHNAALTVAIGASGETWGFANAEMLSRNQAPFYCQPDKLAMTNDQYVQILARKVDEGTPQLKAKDFNIWPMVLLFGLQDTFPCPK